MIKKIIMLSICIWITWTTFATSWSTDISNWTVNNEVICTTIFSPVCDKEGIMYSNSCLAGTKETSFDYCRKPINIGSEEAIIQRAYDLGITKFKTLKTFQWSYPVTRAQAAKMLTVRWKTIYPEIWQTQKLSCKFSDIQNQTPDLQDYITQSCQYGLFQWYQWYFMPTQYITKWQMLIVLKRVISMKYDTTENQPRTISSRQAFYDTAGETSNNVLDKMFFVHILAHSYNILSDSLSFNSSIW